MCSHGRKPKVALKSDHGWVVGQERVNVYESIGVVAVGWMASRFWGWARYVDRCSIRWCLRSDLVDNVRCWPSHSMCERDVPLVVGGTRILVSHITKC